jgi:phosphohistidine phosphatase
VAITLYLVRHGEASNESSGGDDARPLSSRGVRQIESLADQARLRGVKPARVLHSGKLRARQTAEIIAAAVGPREVRAISGLQPEDDPSSAAELAALSDEDIMLVGHMPFMGVLSGVLLGGDGLTFSTGTMVCLVRSSKWKLDWKITGESQ